MFRKILISTLSISLLGHANNSSNISSNLTNTPLKSPNEGTHNLPWLIPVCVILSATIGYVIFKEFEKTKLLRNPIQPEQDLEGFENPRDSNLTPSPTQTPLGNPLEITVEEIP